MWLKNWLAIVLGVFATVSQADTWRLCHEDQDYRPYIHSSGQLNDSGGLLVEILSLAAQDIENTLTFTTRPWKRCLHETKKGRFDAVFAIIQTPRRAREYAFPASPGTYMAKVEYVIFYPRESEIEKADLNGELTTDSGSFDVARYQAIRTLGLQAPPGYVVHQFLRQQGLSAKFEYDMDSGLKQVALGKLHGYIVERRIGEHAVRRLGVSERIAVSRVVIDKSTWHVAFNNEFYNKNRSLIEAFWQRVTVQSDALLMELNNDDDAD